MREHIALDRATRALDAVAASPHENIWISLVSPDVVLAAARQVDERVAAGERLPLAGTVFAVKDNIDVAGMPTTAGCPGYAYEPMVTAPVVCALEDAGAVLVGKTNLDQFATGLVGTRSPYGIVRNVVDPAYISGGSSSGSALAVAAGIVDFSLGTDTAGSGRVPAACNGIVGLKPTRGLLPTEGVVPACWSFDCVSIFAPDAVAAAAVLEAALAEGDGPDTARLGSAAGFRFGVPAASLGLDDPAPFDAAIDRLVAIGGVPVPIDLGPFDEAGALLYDGAFVAERHAAVGAFVDAHPDQVVSPVREIIQAAGGVRASDLAADTERLRRLQAATAPVWDGIDVLALPTIPAIPTVEAVLADPIVRNSDLGRWTNFVNLLDLCAVSVPAGTWGNGLPFGLSLVGAGGRDRDVLAVGAAFCGETALPVTSVTSVDSVQGEVLLCVVGAHLSGMPLHDELAVRGARRVAVTATAPRYELYALTTDPPKPGLVRSANGRGAAIEAEVYALDAEAFGSFVAAVPPPLAVGTVELVDGTWVKGFVCEPRALDGATDITAHGGWRHYVARHTPT